MSVFHKLLKGGAVMFIGQAALQLIGFARNFLVARLVSLEDFGIAALFAATLSVLEAASEFGWDKYLIQNKDGENPKLLGVIHSLTLARAFILSLSMFLLAGPVAALLNAPKAETAFACLALVPLIRGFVHFGMKKVQRQYQYGAEVIVGLASQTAGLCLAVLLGYILGNYWAMLWAMVAQAAAMALASHLVAREPYRIDLDKGLIRDVIVFGWPLLVNGLVIVLTTQGDRILVGARIGLEESGLYAAAAMLITIPGFVMLRTAGALGLPWLSAAQSDPSLFSKRYFLYGLFMGLAAISLFAPLMSFGDLIVAWVFGAKFIADPMLAVWLSVAFAVRMLRGWPTATSLALGDSKNILYSNSIRLLGLFAAVLFLSLGYGYVEVAFAMALGELVAYAIAVYRLRFMLRRHFKSSQASDSHGDFNFRFDITLLTLLFFVCCAAALYAFGRPAVWGIGFSSMALCLYYAALIVNAADLSTETLKKMLESR